jgi:hypothetical protein
MHARLLPFVASLLVFAALFVGLDFMIMKLHGLTLVFPG